MPPRLNIAYPACPLPDSNLFHLYLAWRGPGQKKLTQRLRSLPKPDDVQERKIRIRRAKSFISACYFQYKYRVDLPFLTAFHAASILNDEDEVDKIFASPEWNVLEPTQGDARSAGDLARRLGAVGKFDDEFPIIAAMARRLNRAVATVNPEKYKAIKHHWSDLDVIDVNLFRFV